MYGRMKTVPRFESELRPTDERLMSTTIIMGDSAAAAAQSSAQLGFVSFGIVACRALHQTMANAAAAADSTRGGAGRDAGAASESVRQSKLSSIVLVAPNEGPPIGGAATARPDFSLSFIPSEIPCAAGCVSNAKFVLSSSLPLLPHFKIRVRLASSFYVIPNMTTSMMKRASPSLSLPPSSDRAQQWSLKTLLLAAQSWREWSGVEWAWWRQR